MNFLRSLLCILLLASPASAYLPTLGAGLGAPGTTYQGPGDINGAAAGWWGLRCSANAYSGSMADITDAATGNTTGTRLQCSPGGIISEVVSASACTFVTGNACSSLATTCAVSCNVVTLYDQSGNANNAVQSTNTQRPFLVLNCIGTKYCMYFVPASSQYLATTSNFTQTNPWSVSLVYNNKSGTPNTGAWVLSAGSSSQIALGHTQFTNNSSDFTAARGTYTITVGSTADDTWHAANVLSTSGSGCNFNIDSTSHTGTCGTNGFSSSKFYLGSLGSLQDWNGYATEWGVWAGDKSANDATMNTNQKTYWGY